MTSIRCIHVLPDTDEAGAENQARYLLAGLREAPDVEPEVAYFGRGRAHEAFEALGIPLHEIGRRRRFALDWPRRVRRLRELIAAGPPPVVHTWLLEGNLIGLMAVRRADPARVVISQRGGTGELDFGGQLRLQRLLRRRADHAISNSGDGAELIRAMGLDESRVSVVQNGIAPERVEGAAPGPETRAALGLDPGAPLLVSAARANDPPTIKQKGFPVLFEALGTVRAELPGAKLALVGPTAAELAAGGVAVPEAGVEVLGWRPNLRDYLAAADVVVLASNSEGSSNVAGEALFLGRPVVSTDTGEHTAAVATAGGRVVPIGQADAIATAILALLRDPPAADAVRRAAEAHLSVLAMVERTISIYRSLAPASSPEEASARHDRDAPDTRIVRARV